MSKPKLDVPYKECKDEGCARSKNQQRLFGMALACKRNDYKDCVSDEIVKLAKSMTEKQLRKFAKTTHEGLPKKVRTKSGKPDMRLKYNKNKQKNESFYYIDNFTEYTNEISLHEQLYIDLVLESNLIDHAKQEMERAGLFDKDADYGGSLANSILDMIKTTSEQQFSGFAHEWALEIFNKLVRFKTLSPITSNIDEWTDVSNISGESLWQNKRDPSYFSHDGGKTFWTVNK